MEQTPCQTAVFQQRNEETRSTSSQRQESLSLQSLGNSMLAARASQVALVVKNPPASARDLRAKGTFLGQEGPLEGGGVWQSTPVFLPGESHGQRCLVDCSP